MLKNSSVQDTKSLTLQNQIEPTAKEDGEKKAKENTGLKHLSPDPESNGELPACQ
jgi:hypothetical protein